MPIAVRTFTMEDQLRFARLSGDANPMHVDPTAARRTQYGQVVVHGVHGLMWGLDAAAAQGADLSGVRGVSAHFQKPILLGDAVEAHLEPAQDGFTLTLSVDGLTATKARLTAAAPKKLVDVRADGAGDMVNAARPLDVAEMQGRRAGVRYVAPEIAAAFPALTRALGAAAAEGLAASTYLVGMECPGLDSIFLKLNIGFDPEASGPLAYEAVEADPRHRVVDLVMQAAGVRARINAFARTPPKRGPAMAEAAALVEPGAFAGQRALVIGGSRGLGEAAAKLLAAGGAEVTITYARGAAEAEAVAAEIAAAGGRCAVLRYDALAEAAAQLPGDYAPNAAYYFATSTIGRRKTRAYDPALMAEFVRYHVDGFAELALALRARVQGRLALHYPSSVYAERAPAGLGEYGAAKRAGEAIAQDLAANLRDVAMVVERLPAADTDQNAGVLQADVASAVSLMAPVVRAMQAALMRDA